MLLLFKIARGNGRLFANNTKATQNHNSPVFKDNDVLFGPESRGLPTDVINCIPAVQRIHIPIQANSRSLNLSNATPIILYQAWRQLDYKL